ncbi:MAG: hypothetical protein PHR98_01215 [Candidatus Shapirobacteria bacterium]|jgi:hypothetical protein|nr:hypothetical protein [Candidatus Shapirobacteria bacterium]
MSKEKIDLPKVYKDFFKDYIKEKKTIKININSLIKEIELTEKSFTDNGNMGLTSEYFTENDVRQKVIDKYLGQNNDTQFVITANSKIVKGKKNIIAVSSSEAHALGFIYGLNLWDNPEAIQCCISANNQKCKTSIKITNKVSSPENFIVVSKALATHLKLKDNREIILSNIKFNIKRTNLDKIDFTDSSYGWSEDY